MECFKILLYKTILDGRTVGHAVGPVRHSHLCKRAHDQETVTIRNILYKVIHILFFFNILHSYYMFRPTMVTFREVVSKGKGKFDIILFACIYKTRWY